jgi:hypothetical protein
VLDVARTKQLKSLAQDMALKNGHALGAWEITHITYGGGKKRIKRVEAHKAACKYCKGSTQVSVGLAEQMAGDILENYCETNTGMWEKTEFMLLDECQKLIVSVDLGNIYLRPCA